MNKCADNGYLVAGTASIPSDATDFHVDGLEVVGCSRLRCQRCQAFVRSEPRLSFRTKVDLGPLEIATIYELSDMGSSPLLHEGNEEWRLYLCRCGRWLETRVHACGAADNDSDWGDPMMEWECDGHPVIELPHDLDGTLVKTRAELRDVVARAFRDEPPPMTRPADRPSADWLCRLPMRLRDGDAAVVAEVALELLGDDDIATRARAFELFTQRGSEAADRRIVQILERQPELVAGVPNTVTRYSPDKTLESTAWRIIGARIRSNATLRDRARKLALAGSSVPAVFEALARYDSLWLVANVEALARAAPDGAEALVDRFSELPGTYSKKVLREKVRGNR